MFLHQLHQVLVTQRDGYPVAGRTTANADIEITNAQGEVVGSGTADGDGNYRILIAPDQVTPEENLNVAAIVTARSRVSSATTPVTVPAASQTEIPTIDTIAAGDTAINGTAEPGASVTVAVDGEEPVTVVAE